MPTRIPDEFTFNLASYARLGPGRRERFTSAQKQQIARTVGRTPEVMVKVLSQGASNVRAVKRHLDYIGRHGDVDLATDDGQTLRGRDAAREVLNDWDLKIDELRGSADLSHRAKRSTSRLVHKLMFSMPPGTPAAKVLQAVQNLCREEFALQHRYALALHTDEPHPHVHVVVRAVSEEGVRLNIRKATLREWRQGFARHLRAVGVPANATERSIRGVDVPRKLDGIYRAELRGDSTHVRTRVEEITWEMSGDGLNMEPVKARLMESRNTVRRAWWAVGGILMRDGDLDLCMRVRRFAQQMPAPMTEKEQLVAGVRQRVQTLVAKDRSPPIR